MYLLALVQLLCSQVQSCTFFAILLLSAVIVFHAMIATIIIPLVIAFVLRAVTVTILAVDAVTVEPLSPHPSKVNPNPHTLTLLNPKHTSRNRNTYLPHILALDLPTRRCTASEDLGSFWDYIWILEKKMKPLYIMRGHIYIGVILG